MNVRGRIADVKREFYHDKAQSIRNSACVDFSSGYLNDQGDGAFEEGNVPTLGNIPWI